MRLYFPGFKTKCVTFSYDDGCVHDRRLVELFRNYGLKATFNLVSGWLGDVGHIQHGGFDVCFDKVLPEEIATLYQGFEVAAHGKTHARLTELTEQEMKEEVLSDIDALESLGTDKITGLAYAVGKFDGDVVKVLKSIGIRYARTIIDTYSFALPQYFLTWHPTCHDNDPAVLTLVDTFLKESGDLQLFYIWGHSFELDKPDSDRWANMEQICKRLSGQDDVWYATNGEICEYIEAARQVHEFENPTPIDIYTEIDGRQTILSGTAK